MRWLSNREFSPTGRDFAEHLSKSIRARMNVKPYYLRNRYQSRFVPNRVYNHWDPSDLESTETHCARIMASLYGFGVGLGCGGLWRGYRGTSGNAIGARRG